MNPFRFSSEYFDAETGLVYYNYRYYSPELGRRLRRDPIEEKGGWNLYGMAGNDIANLWDSLGHIAPAAVATAMVVAGIAGGLISKLTGGDFATGAMAGTVAGALALIPAVGPSLAGMAAAAMTVALNGEDVCSPKNLALIGEAGVLNSIGSLAAGTNMAPAIPVLAPVIDAVVSHFADKITSGLQTLNRILSPSKNRGSS